MTSKSALVPSIENQILLLLLPRYFRLPSSAKSNNAQNDSQTVSVSKFPGLFLLRSPK
jgi:hypothetical protein